MSKEITDYQQVRDQLAEVTGKLASLQEQTLELEQILRDEYNCETIEEACKRIAKIEKSIESYDERIEKTLQLLRTRLARADDPSPKHTKQQRSSDTDEEPVREKRQQAGTRRYG